MKGFFRLNQTVEKQTLTEYNNLNDHIFTTIV